MPESVLEIAHEMGRIFNDLDADIAHKLVAPEFVDYEAPPGTPGGPDGYLGTARWMNSVFENANWEHLDSFSDGDKAVIRVRFTGKHVGNFLGIEATGRDVNVEHIHIYRVENGLVVEHWACRQDLFLLAQLGAVQIQLPPTGDAAAH
ncbi:ester cyclase [Kitasatospora sp. SUK 42]|uniref:ester cyclase n=1 Tax=Kitasatospora sp. SUK 42 TaxID=1588882 RepID=UPI0018CA6BA3|nr:ester cyclase [Kitasatospora sp. SUK 42]MBV2154808.1 ester cyclase [Kitasatospora sp. SUK 42]